MVTTTASKHALLIRDIAGPENIPWVKIAYTLVAPASVNLYNKKTNNYNNINKIKQNSNKLMSSKKNATI